jgi:hypothetical protein
VYESADSRRWNANDEDALLLPLNSSSSTCFVLFFFNGLSFSLSLSFFIISLSLSLYLSVFVVVVPSARTLRSSAVISGLFQQSSTQRKRKSHTKRIFCSLDVLLYFFFLILSRSLLAHFFLILLFSFFYFCLIFNQNYSLKNCYFELFNDLQCKR